MATITKIFTPKARRALVEGLMSIKSAKKDLGELTCTGDTCKKAGGAEISDTDLFKAALEYGPEMTASQRSEFMNVFFGAKA